MKKEDKAIIIDKIAETLQQYSCFYLAETAGLDAEATTEIRRACFKEDIKLIVVKNTLLEKAFDKIGFDWSELKPALKESTSLMCCNTGNAPAKLLKKLQKKDQRLPFLKAAYVEETIYVGEENLETLCNIKSKNELIADVVALLQSPAKNVVSALQSGATKLHGILETLSKKEA